MSSYQDIRSMGQIMFGIKISMLVALVWVFTLSKRAFCKFACPIGFFYSGFNYFGAARVVVDKNSCKGEKCNVCWKVCPMDIKLYERGATSQCIGCLECVARCPHKSAKIVRPTFLNWLFSRKSFNIATEENKQK
jgi:ferredoxin-type protein NapH